jgi:hypothetical protein
MADAVLHAHSLPSAPSWRVLNARQRSTYLLLHEQIGAIYQINYERDVGQLTQNLKPLFHESLQ